MVKIRYRNNIKPQSEFNEKIDSGTLVSWVLFPIFFVALFAAGNVWREFMLAFFLLEFSRQPCGGNCRKFMIFIALSFIAIFYFPEISVLF